ncbi:hypothetical protein [Micromonospora sp. NPDC093277]|uniref:hypothetical protein n=1 Tax=Micromonospora sp. NPDC093277 TaxID=3364291 RepID=UPI00382236A2
MRAYVVIRLARDNALDIHPLLYVAALAFILYFPRGPIGFVVFRRGDKTIFW